jgi:hypothetical protein
VATSRPLAPGFSRARPGRPPRRCGGDPGQARRAPLRRGCCRCRPRGAGRPRG